MKRFYTTLLALTLGNTAMASDIEEPSWTLVDTVENVELREYEPSIQAVTQLEHSGQTSAGFQRLAGFIFGGNETGEKIAMTAPVEETLEEGQPVMAFTLPSEYELNDLPAPVDELAAGDLLAVLNPRIDLVAVRDILEVGLDLGSGRMTMTPLGVGCKRVAVHV